MNNLRRWVRNWLSGFSRRAELDRISAFELNCIAKDVHASIGDLYELSGRGPNAASLLPRRMQAVGLDGAALAWSDPAVLRDMQRVCAFCDSRRRCERDLDNKPDGAIWQSYCPNNATFRALR
jgi:hypothetical protein